MRFRGRILLPVVGLLLTACAGVLRVGGPAEPLVDEFVEAAVDGDLERAWRLTGSDPREPVSQASVGFGYALGRGHFHAAFDRVTAADRDRTLGWNLTRSDGTAFWALLDQSMDRVLVRPTRWSITVIDDEGEPLGLSVDGHPAVVSWMPRSDREWYADVVTFQGPRVFEVELARGGRMTARAVRELEGQWRTCCVHFNAATGEVTVFRPGPHRPEGM